MKPPRSVIVLAAALLLPISCGQVSRAFASPSASAGLSASPPATMVDLGFSCQLPVAASNAPADGRPQDGVVGTGGFINFPSGTFARDPKSMTTYVSGKWVPVPRSWVSPDGRRYTYVVNNPEPVVHVVTIATGGDETIAIPSPAPTASGSRSAPTPKKVVAFESEGIYLETIVPNSEGLPHGLSLLQPDTGAYDVSAVHIPDPVGASFYVDRSWVAVHNGIAYTGNANTRDIPMNGSAPYWNELEGRPVDPRGTYGAGFAYSPDAWLRIIGWDGDGQPVLSAESADKYLIYTGSVFGETWKFTSPPVFAGTPGDQNNPTGPAVGDGRAIWFGSDAGIVWYYGGGGAPFERVALAQVHPVRIAGPCLR
jgi:hypothetical protein